MISRRKKILWLLLLPFMLGCAWLGIVLMSKGRMPSVPKGRVWENPEFEILPVSAKKLSYSSTEKETQPGRWRFLGYSKGSTRTTTIAWLFDTHTSEILRVYPDQIFPDLHLKIDDMSKLSDPEGPKITITHLRSQKTTVLTLDFC
jgi:hypothetical protein